MGYNTQIEWTDHTANLWHGCSKIHGGCDHCYAENIAIRWGNKIWGADAPRKRIDSVWKNLERFQAMARDKGTVERVFVGSMMDIFEKPMRLVDSKGNPLASDTGVLRDKFFREVVPASPNLMFLLLTKRPGNINSFIPNEWLENPPKNVMFGTSPVNQATTDRLVSQLMEVKGRKFLSVEPQLSSLSLKRWLQDRQLDWVIQGGESGRGKRPFDLGWAESLRSECQESATPYFFKQIDKVRPIPLELLIRELPPYFKQYESDLQKL